MSCRSPSTASTSRSAGRYSPRSQAGSGNTSPAVRISWPRLSLRRLRRRLCVRTTTKARAELEDRTVLGRALRIGQDFAGAQHLVEHESHERHPADIRSQHVLEKAGRFLGAELNRLDGLWP